MMRATVLVAALTLFVGACGEERTPAPPRPSPTPTVAAETTAGARTVVDMAGRLMCVPDEVTRVVVISPSAAEFALALGLEVIGRPTDLPPGAAESAPTVGSSLNPDFPAIAGLAPDLVIADAAFHGSRTRDFDSFPYPVFILAAGNYEQVLKALESLGRATDREEQADDAIAAIEADVEAILDEIAAARAGRPAPRVLILTGGGRDVFGGGIDTYIGNLVAMLGGTNVLGVIPEGGPIPGYGVVDVGESAATQSDVVLILPSGEGGLPAAIAAEPGWSTVPAFTNSRIHELDTALFLRAPGPRVAEALEQLAQLLWP